MKHIFFTLLLISAIQTVAGQVHPLTLQSESFNTVIDSFEFSVSQSTLVGHVRFLSSDDLAGRRTGEPANLVARNYIKNEFNKSGISFTEQEFSFIRNEKKYQATNIMAKIRGTENPQKHIVVTAHYDHVGIGKAVDGDSIYNGADDNASGTGALIELARYFKKNPPKNSMLFIAFDAEELGLQGARYYVENTEGFDIVLNVNMDMISRNPDKEIYITGTRFTPSLKNYFCSVPEDKFAVKVRLGHDGLDGKDSWVHQSDHFPFYEKGIPFLYFGVEDHPDYHKPSDEFENIDPDFYYEAVRFIASSLAGIDSNIE